MAWSSEDGEVFVFGDNSEGNLGLGDFEPHPGVNKLESFSEAAIYGIKIHQVSIGESHSLALAKTSEGSAGQLIFGWGANHFNQLGDNDKSTQDEDDTFVLVPHQMLADFKSEIMSVHCFSTYSAVVTNLGEVDLIH